MNRLDQVRGQREAIRVYLLHIRKAIELGVQINQGAIAVASFKGKRP
jgi:hypothetical protein